MEIVVE
ncbi:unnamed protein product, partial [Rotaria sp. Silwood2]